MVETLNHIANTWFDWQWAMLWQSTILIGLVVLLDRLLRKRAWPQLRYALWLLVLVKLVLPPSLTSPVSVTSEISGAVRDTVNVRLVRQLPEVASGEWLDFRELSRGVASEAVPVSVLEQGDTPILAPIETSSEIFIVVPDVSTAPVTSSVSTQIVLSGKVYLLLIWQVGVVGLGIGLLIRLKGLYAEHMRSSIGEAPDWFVELVKKTAQEIHCMRVPTVVLSTRVACPAVFGLLRPVLLVPSDRIATMSRRDARHILLHELAHIKRGDLWWHGAHMLLSILYWHHPLVWFTRKHIQNLRELCCDATVARHLRAHTTAYRETLLQTARDLLAQPVKPGLGLLGLFENSNWLTTRLQWLERRTWRYPKLRIVSVVLLVMSMSACILPMAQAIPPEFTIIGRITHIDGGEPVPGVRVGDASDYAKGQFGTVTDSDGRYSYNTWYEEHTVIAKASGYLPEEQMLLTKWIGREKGTVIDFKLKPRARVEGIVLTSQKMGLSVQKDTLDLISVNVGVCDYLANEKQWRRFDGFPLLEKTCDYFTAGLESGDVLDYFRDYSTLGDSQIKVFAFLLNGKDLDDVHIKIDVAGVPSHDCHSWDHYVADAQYGVRYLAVKFPRYVEMIVIRIGMAARPWQTVARSDGSKVVETVDSLTNRFVKFMEPVKLGSRVQMYISHGIFSNYQCRLSVRDTQGRDHPAKRLSGSNSRLRQYFVGVANVPFDDVESYEFQVRPYSWDSVTLRLPSVSNLAPYKDSNAADAGKESNTRLRLQDPTYEWWLKEPETRITIQEGDPLVIEWAMDQALYEETDYLAVGVLGDGVLVSSHNRYRWLASDIPVTVRKTSYGKAWPSSDSLLREVNKKPELLTMGSSRIIVFGFKKGEGPGVGVWDYRLKHHLKCVASARLMVRSEDYSERWLLDSLIQARDYFSGMLVSEKDDDKAFYRKRLSEMAEKWLFSRKVLSGDRLCEMYTVRAGDNLSRIGDRYKVPYECLMLLNHIKQASQLQVGQALKTVHGPFNVQVHRSEKRMDLYLQDTYVKSYDVVLGRPGYETPTGVWRIPANAKLIRPAWADPETGRVYQPDDPDYPLGARWMGLRGIGGDAVGRSGYAIRGIGDTQDFAAHQSRGVIVMRNGDIVELYNMLIPELSNVEVLD